MKKRLLLFPISFFLLVSGCVTNLSVEGSNVQIIETAQKSEYECKRIGLVNSSDTSGLTVGAEKQNALAKLLNKAANAGANAIVILSEDTSYMGTGMTAEALKCKNLFSSD